MSDTLSLLQAAEAARESGQWSESIQVCHQVLAFSPNSVDALAGLALALPQLGRLADADTAADRALHLDPRHAVALRAAAVIRLRQQRVGEAEMLAIAAVKAQPQNARALTALAAVWLVQQRFDEAAQILTKALQDEDIAEVHANLAFLHFRRQNLESAIGHAQIALDKKPFLSPMWRLLANANYSLSRLQPAILAQEQLLHREPANADVATQLGEWYRQAGRVDEAVRMLGRATELAPDSAVAWTNFGTALQASERVEDALQAYAKALELNGAQAEVYNNLGSLYKHRKTWATVVTLLAKLIPPHLQDKALPEMPPSGAALAIYSHAMELKPGYADAHIGTGNVFKDLGRLNETADSYRRAVHFAPNLVEGYNGLALLALDLGDLPGAVGWANAGLATTQNAWRLVSPLLIALWLANACEEAEAVATRHLPEVLRRTAGGSDRSVRVFCAFVSMLLVKRAAAPALYAGREHVGILHVVGESHSLAPANAFFTWDARLVQAKARFVMGTKMHHLAVTEKNQFKACLAAQLSSIPMDDPLLFAIGEIDCRPDEGIWSAHKHHNVPLHELIAKTVDGYLEWLGVHLAGRRPNAISIQGIPAPAYPLTGDRDPGNTQAFLEMIDAVDQRLKAGALARGWAFLDVHAATRGPDGRSNGQWHVDGFHLQAALYTQAEKWLARG